jgi:type VI secretion system protein ImpA
VRLQTAAQSPDEYIHHYLGYTLSDLMAPIGDNEVGESVRHNGVYFNIKEARSSDDPTLPLGVWTHELKTADWQQVKQLALTALAEKSKDLQLGVWLFEACIHINGFSGIAPAALLLQQLCVQYWPNMHPEMVDGDIEYRTNPINWLNDKLTPVLRLIPITNAQLDGDEYSWNDWEAAQHYEKLKNQQSLNNEYEGPSPQGFKQRLAATSADNLLSLVWNIEDAVQALSQLQDWLDDCCGNDSPNLTDMLAMIGKIDDMLSSELQRRGVSLATKEEQQLAGEAQGEGGADSEGTQGGSQSNSGGAGGGGNGVIRDRNDAFICLRKAAEFLMNDDPHSPVPYLVYTACDWGEKAAPDLYQDLFLTKGGQLNIFEMMGLKTEDK